MPGGGAGAVTRREQGSPEMHVVGQGDDRVAVMVIRVWSEGERWRARITRTVDVGARDETVSGALVQEREQLEAVVVESVRAWLEEVSTP